MIIVDYEKCCVLYVKGKIYIDEVGLCIIML